MKQKTIKVSAAEENLIMAIRNYRASFPNGQGNLREYAEWEFYKMMDPFNEEV